MRNTYPPLNRHERNKIAKTRPFAIHKPNMTAVGVKEGVPRWLRQYCGRYGAGVEALLQEWRKNP